MTRLLRAELLKLRTIWSTWVLVGVLVAVDVLLELLAAFLIGRRRIEGVNIVPHGSSQWFLSVFDGLNNTRLLALVLGVIIVTGEYRHKTVTPMYLAEPRRGWNVAAKIGVGVLGGLVLGLVSMLMGLGVGGILVGGGLHSCVTVHLSTSPSGAVRPALQVFQGMSRAACSAQHGIYYVANGNVMVHDLWHVAPTVVFGAALFGLYGIGLGALLKNQVVGIVVGLAFTLVIEPIFQGLVPTFAEYLPGAAASALEPAPHVSFGGAAPPNLLPWWGGVAMLVIYGVALAGSGTFTTLRADVT